jgi:hypothetical protein
VLGKLYAFSTPEKLYVKFAIFVDIWNLSDLLFYKNIAHKQKFKKFVFWKNVAISNLAPCPPQKNL